MELPASFVDYTRSLLGEEEYEKTGRCPAARTTCQYPL